MRKPLLVGISGLWLAGCFGGSNSGGVDAAPPVNDCVLDAEVEGTPGFPYSVSTFETEVWPMLQSGCGLGACHGEGNANRYTVLPDDPSDPQRCNFAKSFNEVARNSDLNNPRNSRIIAALDGTLATHPAKLADGDPSFDLLLGYINAAKVEFDNAGGGGDLTFFFDADVYARDIQPTFDRAGCAVSGCHDLQTAFRGFGLTANAQPGSPEIAANMKAVVNLIDSNTSPAQARSTKIYAFSTNSHAQSVVDNAPALEAWIAAGLELVGGGTGTPIRGCVDASNFNVGVFRDEIMPMLQGVIDYNNRAGNAATGCVRGPCHGTNRGPGSFYIDATLPIEDNLASFSCFVDLLNPSASQLLVCPLNLRRCAKNPHPGEDVFFGVADLNYQKLLSFLYATKNDATPLDFAFFVRTINPIFNDVNAVQDGQLGLTCADTQACHGVLIATQPPPNGSNFGIIPESTDPEDLLLNFVSASNFVLFQDATQSSLFLYPTNEIANRDNPFATGLPHPGGKDFEVDDQEALDILKWAGGLRPNAQGFLTDFLVAGVFPATDITDRPISTELTVAPSIFERSGQGLEFNSGQWDAFSSADNFVDLAAAFNRNVGADETAYAVANVMNSSGRPINLQVVVESPNDVQLFVGGNPGTFGRNGVGATQGITLEPYSQNPQVIRVMVKVFRKAADAEFGFAMRFEDDRGNILNDNTGELVFKLSPKGGI